MVEKAKIGADAGLEADHSYTPSLVLLETEVPLIKDPSQKTKMVRIPLKHC
jgi:hypothetical protein